MEDKDFNFIGGATGGSPASEADADRQKVQARNATLVEYRKRKEEEAKKAEAMKIKFEKMSPEEKRKLGLTDEVRAELQRRAEEPTGVDTEAFMEEFGIDVLDRDVEFGTDSVGGKALAPGARTDLGLV